MYEQDTDDDEQEFFPKFVAANTEQDQEQNHPKAVLYYLFEQEAKVFIAVEVAVELLDDIKEAQDQIVQEAEVYIANQARVELRSDIDEAQEEIEVIANVYTPCWSTIEEDEMELQNDIKDDEAPRNGAASHFFNASGSTDKKVELGDIEREAKVYTADEDQKEQQKDIEEEVDSHYDDDYPNGYDFQSRQYSELAGAVSEQCGGKRDSPLVGALEEYRRFNTMNNGQSR